MSKEITDNDRLLAAVRLLQDPKRISWGWYFPRQQYEYFLDGEAVGVSLIAVIEAEAGHE